jgi:hypothetical protein
MEKQNTTNTMLCWNPGGDVALVTIQEKNTKLFANRLPAGDSRSDAAVFILSMLLTHRDGCSSLRVNAALLEIKEYWDGLPMGKNEGVIT